MTKAHGEKDRKGATGLRDGEERILSLTGENSHKIVLPMGQGSLSIGTRGLSEGKYDVWVEKDSVINWDAFRECHTGYGREHKEKYPYGDWPRWLYYSGDDTGFIAWSSKRKIEEFHWFPLREATVDFTSADIVRLSIHAKDSKIHVRTGDKTPILTLSGALEKFELEERPTIPAVRFCMDYPKEKGTCQLPVYKALAKAACLDVNNSVGGAAFDCASLLQFQDLRSLGLRGNVRNLSALAELKNLESIELRFIPDLQGVPDLESWSRLKHFIGYNVEESAGKKMRAELNQLKKTREMSRYSSVTKLRKPIWFATEHGLPFSGWEEGNAKKAATAYKSFSGKVKKAASEDEVRKAVTEFVEKINRLSGIETTEREDVHTAVSQLMETYALEVSPEKWTSWFDETRDF